MENMNSTQELQSKQYICVKIGTEQYGIDIQYVENIVRMQKITRVPKAQTYFKGVINLRGEIVPVMSLRLKFNLEPDEYTNTTRIIILKLEPQASVGLIVDEVKEVVDLDPSCIDKPTYNANDEKSQFISGVGKHEDGLISLLNVADVIIEKDKDNEVK